MSELMSVVQVAQRLQIIRQAVLGLINRERLPAQKVGNSYVISPADFEAYRLEKLVQAEAQVAILKAAEL